MKVLFDNLIIRRDVNAEKTIGGIIVPNVEKTRQNTGVVLSVGPGYQAGVEALSTGGATHTTTSFVATTILPEQRVLFNPKTVQEISFRGEQVLVTRERDIIAVLDD